MRTNDKCEGYNSRLAKRANLNVYKLILLFKEAQINTEATLLQLEGGQKTAKRQIDMYVVICK